MFNKSRWPKKSPLAVTLNMTYITFCRNVISIEHTAVAVFVVLWLVLPFREGKNFIQFKCTVFLYLCFSFTHE